MWKIESRSEKGRWLKVADDGTWTADPVTHRELLLVQGDPVYPVPLASVAYDPKGPNDPYALLINGEQIIPGGVVSGDVPATPAGVQAAVDALDAEAKETAAQGLDAVY